MLGEEEIIYTITTKVDSEEYELNNIFIGASSMQGKRNEMEDQHIIYNLPIVNHIFVAVFDGHGGKMCAKYCKKDITSTLENNDYWKKYVYEYNNNNYYDVSLLKESLINTFLSFDKLLRNNYVLNSGCTCTLCIINSNQIICANIGDSRTVLGSSSLIKQLSIDHKPNDEIERNRIINAGGSVSNAFGDRTFRINGDIALSRSFGDFHLKSKFNLKENEQMLIAEPDIIIYDRNESDDVLVLACDGLWDVCNNEDVIDYVRMLYKLGESSMLLIAEDLIDHALECGSSDNITVIVLRLPGANIGDSSGGGVLGLREYRGEFKQKSDIYDNVIFMEKIKPSFGSLFDDISTDELYNIDESSW